MLKVLFGYFYWPAFLIVITVFGVRLLAFYGGLPRTPLGIDLTMFTYGFLCDLLVRAFQGRAYWQQYPKELLENNITRPKLLSAMALLILVFLVLSLWCEKRWSSNPAPSWARKKGYRVLTFIFGLLGIIVVTGTNALWGSQDG